jgi:hypothetical protein
VWWLDVVCRIRRSSSYIQIGSGVKILFGIRMGSQWRPPATMGLRVFDQNIFERACGRFGQVEVGGIAGSGRRVGSLGVLIASHRGMFVVLGLGARL